jgi:hypothetical protein
MKIDQISILFYSQVNLYLKCISTLSNSTLYIHNILNFLKLILNNTLTSQFQSYFLPIFIIQKLLRFYIQIITNQWRSWRFNIFNLKKINLFFYLYVKICLNYKPNFKQIIFQSTLLCFCPFKFY